MADFITWIADKLQRNDFEILSQKSKDLIVKTPENDVVWICYLDSEVLPEYLRRCFEFTGHLLFVVDDKLIPQAIESREATPMWLRVLHGLYMGRVYTWNGKFLYGLHFDYDEGDVSESPPLDPEFMFCIETGTWLRGWSGNYHLARFPDKAWWGVQNPFSSSSKQSYEQSRKTWEDMHRQQWTPPPGGDNAYQWKYSYGGSQQKQTYDTPWAKQTPPKDGERNFLAEMNACASKAELKTLYRKLLREFHPDVSSHPEATEISKLINVAYAQAEKRWS